MFLKATMETPEDKLREIIENVFKIKLQNLDDGVSPDTIETWDSMNHLLFISELEGAFGVKFSMNDVLYMKNIGDVKKMLKKYEVEI